MFGRVGVACQRADAVECAGLVRGAFAVLEQVCVGSEKVEHLGKAACGEAVAAADAGAFLQVDLEGVSTGAGTLQDPSLGIFDSQCNLLLFNDDRLRRHVSQPNQRFLNH